MAIALVPSNKAILPLLLYKWRDRQPYPPYPRFSSQLSHPSLPVKIDLIAMRIEDIPINQIHRPLYRQNDPETVMALMLSIQAIGLQEPIDVLEVDGKYYGFSGCHRYEACSRLGHETIRCRVRRAPKSVLRMHLA